jgi:hypothetical protein
MIVDPRVYETVYALCVFGWLSSLYPISRAKPGDPTFRYWLGWSSRIMGIVATVVVTTGVINAIDWIWS